MSFLSNIIQYNIYFQQVVYSNEYTQQKIKVIHQSQLLDHQIIWQVKLQILFQLKDNKTTIMHWTIIGIIAVPVLLILYVFYMFFVKIYVDAARYKKMDPTLKVYIAPFSGLQGVQKRNLETYGDSHRFTKELLKESPDQLAYFTNLGYKPLLILCDAKLIKFLCLNPKKFRKFNILKHSDHSFKQGVFFAEGQDWTAKKLTIRDHFKHQSLKSMIPSIDISIKNFFKTIKADIDNSPTHERPFDVVHESQTLIGEILVRIFFSEAAVNKEVMGKKLSLALTDFTTEMFRRARTGQNIIMEMFLGESVTRYNFSEGDRKLQKMLFKIRDVLIEILDERLARDDDQLHDFIYDYIKRMREIDSQIAEAEKEGRTHKLRKITKEQIVQQLISFYFAGIDTTGHLIAMALYALAEYPEEKKKVIEELTEVIRSPSELTYENLQKLEYMGKLLDECLRMWCPATGILLRLTQQDMELGPYKLRKNSLVGVNLLGMMHNPKYYKDPQVFNPSRWNDKALYNQEPYSFIPFSAGTRSCIGKYLALMEAKMMLIGFLTNFQIQRTDVPLRMYAKFLYQPVDPQLIKLKRGGVKLGESNCSQ